MKLSTFLIIIENDYELMAQLRAEIAQFPPHATSFDIGFKLQSLLADTGPLKPYQRALLHEVYATIDWREVGIEMKKRSDIRAQNEALKKAIGDLP